ncbi:MAG: substrate-binding domain-containing protein [Planctomycetes bacterium]|nr:substrate-binding domain-containing protein [Planctomycetota bacterium]
MARRPRGGRPAGPVPVYRKIVAAMQAQLASGKWAIGQPIPSCRELAQEYGVGIKTIWRAQHALRDLGHLHIARARRATAVRRVSVDEIFTGAVVLVLRSGLTWFSGMDAAPGLGHGVFRALQETRETCIVVQHMEWWRHRCPEGLRDLPIKGLLLWGPFTQALLRQYAEMNVRTVLLDQPPAGVKMNAVTVDNFAAAFDATSRLLKKGHTQLAFIRSVVHSLKDIDPDARERQEGFLAACRQAGLTEQNYRIVSATLLGRSDSIRKVLRAKPRPTAIVSATLAHLPELSGEAHACGLKIPRHLSVATFRVKTDEPNWSGPEIDFEKMGSVAVEVLKRNSAAIETVRIKTTWHEGKTIAGPG